MRAQPENASGACQGAVAEQIKQGDRVIESESNLSPASLQALPFHADSLWRRRKTDAELFAGCEFHALAERWWR